MKARVLRDRHRKTSGGVRRGHRGSASDRTATSMGAGFGFGVTRQRRLFEPLDFSGLNSSHFFDELKIGLG